MTGSDAELLRQFIEARYPGSAVAVVAEQDGAAVTIESPGQVTQRILLSDGGTLLRYFLGLV